MHSKMANKGFLSWQSSDSSVDSGDNSHSGKVEQYSSRYSGRNQAGGNKCLPCFTHLSTGACIYGDHCCFIHDRRIAGNCLPNTTLDQRNHVDHKIRDDPIYWPPSLHSSRSGEYILDPKIVYHDDLRYKSVYSIWSFFVNTMVTEGQGDLPEWDNYPVNPVTKRERLSVFTTLAEGKSVPAAVPGCIDAVAPSAIAVAKFEKKSFSKPMSSKITSHFPSEEMKNDTYREVPVAHVHRKSSGRYHHHHHQSPLITTRSSA